MHIAYNDMHAYACKMCKNVIVKINLYISYE